MRVVETLLVRDEVDVIEAHLSFHLNAGVDFVIATDHDSQDGTTEILEWFARDGYLRRIPEHGALDEVAWRTRMARLACDEHGADWVVNADADQFWWPRGGSLEDVLGAVPARFGAVHAFDRVFVPRLDDGSHFAERMVHRLSARAAINAPMSTYRPLARVIHRADPGVRVSRGGHATSGTRLVALANWHPIEVLHFPWRSPAQMARKASNFVNAGSRHATVYHAEAHRAARESRLDDHFASLAVDDRSFARGLAGGVLVEDTRLRDGLRLLAGGGELREGIGRFPRPHGSQVSLRHLADDETAYAAEAAALREAAVVRASRVVDRFEARVRALEDGLIRPRAPAAPEASMRA